MISAGLSRDTGFEVVKWGIQASRAFYLGTIVPGGTLCKIADEGSPMYGKPLVLFEPPLTEVRGFRVLLPVNFVSAPGTRTVR